jgi:sarcosine oxidase, subunit gamma
MTFHDRDPNPAPLAQSAAATVTLLAPVARFSLRARRAALPALSAALGMELPQRIGERSASDEIEVLCLGPDEWLILAPGVEADRISAACADVYPQTPHSLTEISDREVTARITGPKATDMLTLGCPRDIDSIAPGDARRTIFDGATIVLWRDGDQDFRMDVWRSFAPHVFGLLETGCTELAAE